jgi:outer membrane protein OmpA-like peptidoglycan-associated protein
MTNGTHRSRRASVIALTGTAVLALGSPAVAQEDDVTQPPGYVEPEAPEIDENASGLMLSDGATLAEPRVLDIKSVTEDLGGEDDADTGGTEDPDDGETPDDSGGGGAREETTPGQHKFTLQTDVLFAEGSADIAEEAEDSLAEVAAAIDQYRPADVNIFGFTDNQGSYESGEALSEDRAQNTYEALRDLIESPEGIVFNVRGYSEDFPLYDNKTEEGRQKNRRVEISWPTEE